MKSGFFKIFMDFGELFRPSFNHLNFLDSSHNLIYGFFQTSVPRIGEITGEKGTSDIY